MTAGSQCCCFHVKSCATLVAVIGIIFSVLQIISVIFLWWYVPMSIIMLITYIFVLVGVSKERPGFLLPAEIILGINVVISCLIIIGLIILGITLPDNFVKDYSSNSDYYNDFETAQKTVRIFFFILAFLVLLASSYNIFSFIVIRRARVWIRENESTRHPQGYVFATTAVHPPPQQMHQHVYHANSPPPPPQQYSYGAPGYPQQQGYPPQQQQQYPAQGYPGYNPSPQPSPQQGYNNDPYVKF